MLTGRFPDCGRALGATAVLLAGPARGLAMLADANRGSSGAPHPNRLGHRRVCRLVI